MSAGVCNNLCTIGCVSSLVVGVNTGVSVGIGAIANATAGTIGATTGAVFGALPLSIDVLLFSAPIGGIMACELRGKISPKTAKALELLTCLISTVATVVIAFYLLPSLGYSLPLEQICILATPALLVKLALVLFALPSIKGFFHGIQLAKQRAAERLNDPHAPIVYSSHLIVAEEKA